MSVQIKRLLTNGKAMILACDQGLEHGPSDFNQKNIDPKYILDIALEGNYNGIILQNGIAEKYYSSYYREVPLILKLNGKTRISQMNPLSKEICSVERAIKLGASAVGYTVYDGTPAEQELFKEFGKVVEKAHDYGLPVIAWMYPRGPEISHDITTELLAYAARVGLELGADFLKLKYNGDLEGFKWVVKCAGRAKVLIAGGEKVLDRDFLKKVQDVMTVGVTGLAVGRNVWQHEKPYGITNAIRKIIFENFTAEEAMRYIEDK